MARRSWTTPGTAERCLPRATLGQRAQPSFPVISARGTSPTGRLRLSYAPTPTRPKPTTTHSSRQSIPDAFPPNTGFSSGVLNVLHPPAGGGSEGGVLPVRSSSKGPPPPPPPPPRGGGGGGWGGGGMRGRRTPVA